MKELIFEPQPGPQTDFLATSADICIYGGAAGGGKSWGLLLDWARLVVPHPNINGVIFRRKSTQLTLAGSIWPESYKIFTHLRGLPNNKYLEWRFKNRSTLKFSGLQYEGDKHNFDGTNLDWVGFDELTHFTETQFFHMLSRLRSTTGAFSPYIRGTCNPSPDSWVYHLIRWWIGDDGYAIKERSGVIRWFFRHDDTPYWFDSKEGSVCIA